MPYETSIACIDNESVLAECGPMRLIIRGWKKNRPQVQLAKRAAEVSISYLERIVRCRPLLSQPFPEIGVRPSDDLAMRMLGSVQTVGDHDLTPMAAVAGTIADAVADWLFERGLTKVVVDNGGDVAIKLAQGERATVGVRPQVGSRFISHLIGLDSSRSAWGVTTSGMGGRSFTRGIASAVTVLANNASVADAAATAVANSCVVEDRRIRQLPAEKIDPNSDLRGTLITTAVGPLSEDKKRRAIDRAREKAESLVQKNAIIGAFIALENQFAVTDSLQPYISEASEIAG